MRSRVRYLKNRTLLWLATGLRLVRYPASIYGAVIIAVLWIGLAWQLSVERARALDAAIERGSSIARLFEESTIRLIKGIDRMLLLLRVAYEQNPENFDIRRLAEQTSLVGNLTIEAGMIGSDGYMKATTAGYSGPPLFLGDRDHFKAQVNAKTDELYIGKPVKGRASGKTSIQLTRRLRKSDGTFDGVLVASIDPKFVEEFHQSMKLGEASGIGLRGLDGIIRAFYGYTPATKKMSRGLADATARAPDGYFWSGNNLDPTKRLVSYRAVAGYPLFATVGETGSHIFADYERRRIIYATIVAFLTLLVLIAVVIGIRHRLSREQTTFRFSSALENMSQGLCMFDEKKRLIVFNDHYAKLYRLPPELLQFGTPHSEIIAHRVRNGILKGDHGDVGLREQMASLSALSADQRSRRVDQHADGRLIRVTREPMKGGGWVATHEDITEHSRTEAQIAHLAHHDALTDLANRVLLRDKIDEALSWLRRDGTGFAVFLLDLDKFKEVNDSLGHSIGDALLRKVAGRLKACTREVDTVARLGGDEFAVLQQVGEDDLKEGAIILATRLLDAISAPYEIDGHKIEIGTSAGITLAPHDGTEADLLLKYADLAMYRVKSQGRNSYCFFSVELDQEMQARRALTTDLREALARGEFELFYQPLVNMTTGAITGVEALIRWRHPKRGLISPDAFISHAEETGLIVPIGEWVLRTACADAMAWPADVKVAVNLSPVQFKRGNLVDTVIYALSETGLPPHRLQLEVTESVLLEKSADNLSTMHQLRQFGVGIVLDDFGTGFSSLLYLQQFPFDKIKIDRSFVSELPGNTNSAAIICAVNGLARGLNIGTLAEGVETQEQCELLKLAGCNEAQGFLFGKPMPTSALDFAALKQQAKPYRAA